jgi:hypothetical protein
VSNDTSCLIRSQVFSCFTHNRLVSLHARFLSHFLSSLPDIPSQEKENECLNGSLNTKMTMNDVTTGNVAEVAAITLFLCSYSDDNLGKRDYNPDKQQPLHFTYQKLTISCGHPAV